MNVETIGQTLQRLARKSLPRYFDDKDKNHGSKRCAICGDALHYNNKVRQCQPVCDACAAIIPRSPSGRRPSFTCFECRAIIPRLKLKMKCGDLYCKKCLKIKFNIDF